MSEGFAGLGVSSPTQRALSDMGYGSPTEVQRETIPRSLAGRDLVVMSRTGTGKTAAFGVAISDRVDTEQGRVQALVLTPTRELAVQVTEELKRIGRGRGVRVQSVYGGDSMAGQIEGIRSGAQVVVGTPGRVLDHLRRGTLRLDGSDILVLDEADKMLDMGFAEEMGEILKFAPSERQTLLFSATIPAGIRGLIYNYLIDPEWVLLSEDFAYVKSVHHGYLITPHMQKEDVLYRLMEHDQPASSMIFCNTRGEARTVAGYLAGRGLPVGMISSDLTQRKREQVMERFRAGEIQHLVATDVAARGIDIEDLSHVFIYSTPSSPENYIHRAGRTGRIGKSGNVISLVSASDLVSFNRLVNRYHLKVVERSVPTDAQIRVRRRERLLARLADEAESLEATEREELEDVAQALMARSDGASIIAYLIRHDFREPVVLDEVEPEVSQPESEAFSAGSDADENQRKRKRRRRSRARKPASTHR